MSWTISVITHAIWAWLPEITVGLRFATAVIAFYMSATTMIQRLHRRMRHQSASRDEPKSLPARQQRW